MAAELFVPPLLDNDDATSDFSAKTNAARLKMDKNSLMAEKSALNMK